MNITSFLSHTIKKEEKQMKKSKKDYPVTPAYEDIMFNEAGSSNECTGLIPSAVLTESEYDSYEALYDFCLPSSVKEDIEKK